MTDETSGTRRALYIPRRSKRLMVAAAYVAPFGLIATVGTGGWWLAVTVACVTASLVVLIGSAAMGCCWISGAGRTDSIIRSTRWSPLEGGEFAAPGYLRLREGRLTSTWDVAEPAELLDLAERVFAEPRRWWPAAPYVARGSFAQEVTGSAYGADTEPTVSDAGMRATYLPRRSAIAVVIAAACTVVAIVVRIVVDDPVGELASLVLVLFAGTLVLGSSRGMISISSFGRSWVGFRPGWWVPLDVEQIRVPGIVQLSGDRLTSTWRVQTRQELLELVWDLFGAPQTPAAD